MGHYLLKDAPKTGTGDLLISVQAVNPLQIPRIEIEANIEFKSLLKELIANNSLATEAEIGRKVFNLYNLSRKEQEYIEDNFM